MRRAIAIAALVAAATAWAAISAPAGKVIDIDNYDAAISSSYVNASQCAGASPLRLEWNTTVSTAFNGGQYRLYASSATPYTSGTNSGFCAESNDDTASPQIKAALVDSYTATTQIQQELGVPGPTVVTNAGQSCTEGSILYVCSHWYDTSGTRKGIAWGKFIVQVNAPAAPTGVSAGSGDGKLVVTFTEVTSGTPAKEYVAEAYGPGKAPPDTPDGTDTVQSSPATIKGLTNGTEYTVYVVAYSKGGNPSARSASAIGTPQPSAGFWDVYAASGGPEQGGCAGGAGGALSLLATASLLVLRRRKP